MSATDGGPAFDSGCWDSTGRRVTNVRGMSLRDYFAGKALGDGKTPEAAYAIADKMLELKEYSKNARFPYPPSVAREKGETE